MCLESRHFFMRVVVEGSQLEVVRARDKPLFSSDEVNTANRNLCNLEGFNQSPGLVVINMHRAIVESR